MTPTTDFLRQAASHIRRTLDELRPKLLEAQGNIEHKLKDDKSVVTAMDACVEETLRQALAKFDRGIGFGGEEAGVDFNQKTFWLTDPIDGTEAFVRNMPFATNMVALIHDGQPVMSVINNFSLGDFYLAIEGQGATCNGHPIQVSNRHLDRAWVVLSVAASSGVTGLVDYLSPKVKAVRRFGAGGYDYTQVACGAIEARISFKGNGYEWDFAPGALLVREAGGRVANVGEDGYNYRKFDHIAANPLIFDQLQKFIKDFAAKL